MGESGHELFQTDDEAAFVRKYHSHCLWWKVPGWTGYATGCGFGPKDIPENNKCPICGKEIEVSNGT